MLSRRIIPSCIRHTNRGLSTTIESTAKFVFENSCYHKTDFKIQEDSPVAEVIAKFVAFDVGCLAVLDKEKKLIGVVSQRDIITKVCTSDKFNPSLKVKDICTYGNNIIVAKTEDSVETCMNKMNYKKVRHLLVVDDKNPSFVGMISMKDIIQEMLRNKTELVMRLSDFKIGKGAFFGSE
jgi:CBS domain-containing protein